MAFARFVRTSDQLDLRDAHRHGPVPAFANQAVELQEILDDRVDLVGAFVIRAGEVDQEHRLRLARGADGTARI